jgi:hypothetical protein
MSCSLKTLLADDRSNTISPWRLLGLTPGVLKLPNSRWQSNRTLNEENVNGTCYRQKKITTSYLFYYEPLQKKSVIIRNLFC